MFMLCKNNSICALVIAVIKVKKLFQKERSFFAQDKFFINSSHRNINKIKITMTVDDFKQFGPSGAQLCVLSFLP